jgi:hypothetical protein
VVFAANICACTSVSPLSSSLLFLWLPTPSLCDCLSVLSSGHLCVTVCLSCHQAICAAAGGSLASKALRMQDGTFLQEPGSGVRGLVEDRQVAVGTQAWVNTCWADAGTATGPGTATATGTASQPCSDTSSASTPLVGNSSRTHDEPDSAPGKQCSLQCQEGGGTAAASRHSSNRSDSASSSQLRTSPALEGSSVPSSLQARDGGAAESLVAQTSAAPLTPVSSSQTRVLVALDGRLVGAIHIEDQLRPDALATIQDLQQQGMRTVLLSG